MTAPLVLSLFPGIGLLDMAFEEEGFCVVRGPDLIWGGDVRRFHPPEGRFDGIIGGPPCQVHSGMGDLNPLAGRKHGDQIPEFERCVAEAGPEWFVMENVPDAPTPLVEGYRVHTQIVRDVWVGGETMRRRRISFGNWGASVKLAFEQMALHTPQPQHTVLAGHGRAAGQRARGGAEPTWRECARLQGLPESWIATVADNHVFTVQGYKKVIGNGVPLAMGRAIARAVKAELYPQLTEAA